MEWIRSSNSWTVSWFIVQKPLSWVPTLGLCLALQSSQEQCFIQLLPDLLTFGILLWKPRPHGRASVAGCQILQLPTTCLSGLPPSVCCILVRQMLVLPACLHSWLGALLLLLGSPALHWSTLKALALSVLASPATKGIPFLSLPNQMIRYSILIKFMGSRL